MTKRLDQLVAEMMKISRNKAQNLVKEGCVFVDGQAETKPAFEVDYNKNITIQRSDNFVSRGAKKLIKALDEFAVKVSNKKVLDMGASTGGFTQVLLENGAKKVYSVDVGVGEIDKSLKNDARVVNMEGRDIRTLTIEEVGDAEMIVGDLSFISLMKVLPHIYSIFGNIEMVLLFKPQFECGKEIAKKYKGVIKDKMVHKKLLTEFCRGLDLYEYRLSNCTYSPIKGGSGNIEYLIHINGEDNSFVDLEKIVDSAFENL